jgi:hypothetical protein
MVTRACLEVFARPKERYKVLMSVFCCALLFFDLKSKLQDMMCACVFFEKCTYGPL